jgi:hypothetical protein
MRPETDKKNDVKGRNLDDLAKPACTRWTAHPPPALFVKSMGWAKITKAWKEAACLHPRFGCLFVP